ncbi:hypothetical protein KP509_1Z004200 [Ceratopteris richardii]|nr:hypothetical protein KP509_1Z004200 [Ceratopteris richardii]
MDGQLLELAKGQGWGWDGYNHSQKLPDGCCLSESQVDHREKSPQAVLGGVDQFSADFSLSLPDELLEKVLVLLSTPGIFRARAVCRRWKSITSSTRFYRLCKGKTFCAPWYFMYKESKESEGLVYDPKAKKWHSFCLPGVIGNADFVASSHGIACFADNVNGYRLYMCNIMTKACKQLPEPYPRWSADHYAVAISLDRNTKELIVVVARSNQWPDNYSHCTLNIDIYKPSSAGWHTSANATLVGWRGGDNSVICNGIFYCVLHSTAMLGTTENDCRHALLCYDLSSGSLQVGLTQMPCSLTCVKLINCDERLIMVGGIGKADIVRGIGVWELTSKWTEISRMPNRFFRGFGEFDDVFSSSGMGDLIYIHAFGSPQLLLFGLRHHTWRWSQKCPMVKKHPLHLFTGFCFEPRIDACP